ncbi:MAG: hypothetical protein QOE35_537 [Actinomycetota bacterium]
MHDLPALDWFGPAHPEIPDGVVAETDQRDGVTVLRLRATRAIDGLATGEFARPAVAWRFSPSERELPGATAFGFQGCEFALPTFSDASLERWFLLPHRPSTVMPMWLTVPGGATVLLGPLNAFHEQIITVADGLAWGWHGDLDRVDAGFSTELAVVAGSGPRACLERWASMLPRVTRSRYADVSLRTPTYWTDNGAAYWYRTEPGHDVPGTLEATVADLRDRNIPVGAVQLDSWFYPHETLRPFDTDDWVVPPTGMMRWEPRDDILPDGMAALRERLGGPPLITHCRHLSSSSPYVEEFPCWVDGDRAHPQTAAMYERLLDQCVTWGIEVFEHDWLIECFLGVRGLREAPGRARAWQDGIDAAARARGRTLQWCMAAPADFCTAAGLPAVTSIRTSGDHGYIATPEMLWAWFLYTNALARALGLTPFKDVFLAGSAHAEIEALLSVMSTGPVAVGDRLGQADPVPIARTHRADGMLVKPDVPIAAIDRAFFNHVVARPALLTAETGSTHAAGTWRHVLTINAFNGAQPLTGRVEVAELGVTAPVLAYDWRSRTAEVLEPGGGWDLTLDTAGWDYRVLVPLLPDGTAVVGDAELFATAGDMRIAEVDPTGSVTVLGAGERVHLTVWDGELRTVDVDVPSRGWAVVEV